MDARYVLNFQTSGGSAKSLTVRDANVSLNADAVKSAMQSILDASIFFTETGDLFALDTPKLIVVEKQQIMFS